MNSATEHRTCPNCGAAIPAKAPQGLCPKCLMAAAAVSTDAGQTGGKRPEPPSLERLAAAFPQLEVLEFIGQGGMGAVYKARQKQLDRIVALKVLPPGIGGDPAFAERFTREAKALAKLMHPNIVALFEFGQADGIYYLLMEFVDGASLGQLLRASRVSAREALAIVPQICDALQYAHDQGIVHRDIKPENILLDRRGRVKVADFGLAKLVAANALLTPSLSPSDSQWQMADGKGESAPLTSAGKIMGTPNYMAPEQVEHPGEVDHRVDIYALGVVFYQMLTGELPGKCLEAPSKKVQIDVRLDEVVLRALEKDPERRYAQASVLKTQVETIATDMRSAIAPPTGTSAKGGAAEATTLCATKKKKGEFMGVGCAFQALGIACFFIPSVGWILGIILLLLGGHMALKVLCSHCGNPTTREARICTTCGAHFLPKGASAPSTGQVEEQRSKFSWIGTLPKLNGPFVVMRGNRRVLNWPVIGYVVGMVLAMFCVVLRIMDHGSRANLILLFGLFALDYIVRGWHQPLSSLEAQSAKPDVAPAPARGRDYRTRQTLLGLPLVHVAWGIDPATGRPRVAKGILAVGPAAFGVIAVGFSAWGLFPCGLVACGFWTTGLFAVGFWAVGLAAAGFQAVGLLALAFWRAVGLVAVGPTPIGLERIVVDKGMVGVLFALAIVVAWLMDRLIRAIGSAADAGTALRPGATRGGPLAAPTTTARRKLVWIIWACLVPLLLINLCWVAAWWTRREPLGVWFPNRIDPTVSDQYGEAAVRVTEVSRHGQVVLVKLICESPDDLPEHKLLVQYSGPIFNYATNIASTVTNVDCLVAPTFTSGDGKALAGLREMHGAAARQIGFVLPDEMTAAKVADQIRATHLGKPRGLAEHSVLLLFSLHRNVGKDAKGKMVLENLSGMLRWPPDNDLTMKPTGALSFDPVMERVSTRLVPAARVNTNTAGFSPVTERTVNLSEPERDLFLDFETGKVMKEPSGRLNTPEPEKLRVADETLAWARSSGADVLIRFCIGKTSPNSPVEVPQLNLRSLDMAMFPTNTESWDGLSSQTIGTAVSSAPEHGWWQGLAWGARDFTFLFRTRQGNAGILLVTEYTDKPRSMKLCYKMVLPQRDEGK